MTLSGKTIRIYNNPRIKGRRFNLDDGEVHVTGGIPFTRRSWICMGHCPMCRDPKTEPTIIRKRLKEDFRFQLRQEEVKLRKA